MPKIGDILWIFHENDYFVGEISKLCVVALGYRNDTYYFVNTNGIIGWGQSILIPTTADFNTLVKIQYYSAAIYCTISESVATNYIRDHFNETDKTFNEDLIIN